MPPFVPQKRWSSLALVFCFLALVGLTDESKPKEGLTDAPKVVAPSAPSATAEGGSSGKLAVERASQNKSKTEPVLTRFNVVASETGAPLVGAKLSVNYFFMGGMDRQDMVTDETGTGLIPDKGKKNSGGINVFVTPEGYVPKVISWTGRDNIPAGYTMRMDRATRVAGVVNDEQGRAVSGVRVNLARPGIRDRTDPENIDFHPRATAVTTDAEGRWSFHYVPKEFETVGILLNHPDYATTYRSVPVLKPESTNAILMIERGVVVRGRVVGPDGSSVSGAQIKELHYYDGFDERSTQTAPDGSYSLKGLRPGEIKLIVQAEGFAPQFRTLNETRNLAQASFSLIIGKVIRGRVVAKDGKPIAGAVAHTDWDKQNLRRVPWQTRTDADGRFEWKSAPDEPLQYWFEAEGFDWQAGVQLTPGEDDHEIVLQPKVVQPPPVRTSGRAIDAVTQQPLPSFKVSIGEVRNPYFPPEYGKGTQGKDGAYRLTLAMPCPFPSYVLMVEAEGYLPSKSQVQAVKDGNKTLDFALTKGAGPSGTVRLPDGRPGNGAMVYYCTLREGVYMDKAGEHRSGVLTTPETRADEQGRFSLPIRHDGYSIIVLHDEGFREVKIDDFQRSTNIVLSPWGRVEGRLYVGAKPAAGESISLQTIHYRYGDGVRHFASLSLWLTAETDADGNFAIVRVPPGEHKIAHRLSFHDGKPGTLPITHGFPFTVKAGETTRVTLGGTGRPVVGRVVVEGHDEPIDWSRDVHRLALKLPDPSEQGRPERGDFEDMSALLDASKAFSARHRAFWTSDEGRALERAQRGYVPVFNADGSFRVEDVPAGTYELIIKPTRSEDDSMGSRRLPENDKPIGLLTNVFTIPQMPNGRSDEPFDLGTLTLKAPKTLKIGQLAPAFEIQTLEGKPIRLADYRGKFVLLDFWATWCAPCVAELPHLKTAYEAFQNDDRFVMLGLSVDRDAAAPRQFARKNDVKWTQCLLGDWSKTTMPSDYAVDSIPALILIGPDGKILARDLRGPAIKSAVANALRKN